MVLTKTRRIALVMSAFPQKHETAEVRAELAFDLLVTQKQKLDGGSKAIATRTVLRLMQETVASKGEGVLMFDGG